MRLVDFKEGLDECANSVFDKFLTERRKCSVQSSHVLISIRSVLALNANGSQGVRGGSTDPAISISAPIE